MYGYLIIIYFVFSSQDIKGKATVSLNEMLAELKLEFSYKTHYFLAIMTSDVKLRPLTSQSDLIKRKKKT